jgi:hypothetical protein
MTDLMTIVMDEVQRIATTHHCRTIDCRDSEWVRVMSIAETGQRDPARVAVLYLSEFGINAMTEAEWSGTGECGSGTWIEWTDTAMFQKIEQKIVEGLRWAKQQRRHRSPTS